MIIKHLHASGQVYYEVENQKAVATIFLQGVHITNWRPKHCGQEVLWINPQAEFLPGKPIRGGVPFCWPWFGDLDGKPSHGFARNMDWVFLGDEGSDADVDVLSFVLHSNAETKELWPFDFELHAEFHIGETLLMKFSTRNTGESPIAITQAIHTYFNVSNISKIGITGLDGAAYFDKSDGQHKINKGIFKIDKVENDIFQSAEELTIEDKDYNHFIVVDKSKSSGQTVIWNPWAETAKNIPDMADDGYLTMVCIEAGNVGPAITIGSNQEFEIYQKIRVLPNA